MSPALVNRNQPSPSAATRKKRGTVAVRLNDYNGGVGLWGAVPAQYDTTLLPMDRGIHVHARETPGKGKRIDRTYSAVRILSDRLPTEGILVSERAAIYYMISTVLGIAPQSVICPECDSPHLDEDWYSVHPHKNHICEVCHAEFVTSEAVVGNPAKAVQETCGLPSQHVVHSKNVLDIAQADYKNGMLIWGSNPAFLWSGKHSEQEGMHIHVFGKSAEVPELDETYGVAKIDGKEIEARTVRYLMAQSALPLLRGKIASVECPKCRFIQFDTGSQAYTPVAVRECQACHEAFSTEAVGEVVSNPALVNLEALTPFAVRNRQRRVLNLPKSSPVPVRHTSNRSKHAKIIGHPQAKTKFKF